MHIKQIIIQGFKSYKEQTVIEPFSPKHNVIVGRNGSGKSNFFAAIRYVLSDAYTQMGREERQALLHEGSGSAVMSAYVEIIFDNEDERFPTGNKEVVIRRTIGLKKDEYSLDRKSASKSDVMNLLESAGFSRSNPYYIVPQGRVTTLTNMKDPERLTLLKEVAGTQVYEARRSESLKIMGDTEAKRSQIDELLSNITERLEELEEEKNELKEYQDKDRERRCLEYTLHSREQTEIQRALETLDSQRDEGAEESDRNRQQFVKDEKLLASIDDEMKRLRQQVELLQVDKKQYEDQRREAAKRKAQVELELNSFTESGNSAEAARARQAAEAQHLRDTIQAKEQQLKQVLPQYQNAMKQESAVKIQFENAEASRSRLFAKQGRSSQFKNRKERDDYLKKEIAEVTANLSKRQSMGAQIEEDVATLRNDISRTESEVENIRSKLDSRGDVTQQHSKDVQAAREIRDKLQDERKELWREDNKLNTIVRNLQSELDQAERALSHMMDHNTSRGLAAVRRIQQQKGLTGVYGTLAELFEVPDLYKTATEVTAGNSLFHVVVDNDDTATQVLEELQKHHAGRVTFMPLNRLRPDTTELPKGNDVRALIEKLSFDAKYKKAFQQVFGKTLVCPNLAIASQYARSHGVNAITVEGDRSDKKGALTGGYHDDRHSRMDGAHAVRRCREELQAQNSRRNEVKRELEVKDQECTRAQGELQKAEQKRNQFESSFFPLQQDLRTKQADLNSKKDSVEAKERSRSNVETACTTLQEQQEAYQKELLSEFKSTLTPAEEQQVQNLNSSIPNLKKKYLELNNTRAQLEGQKSMLETELRENLQLRLDSLQAQGQEHMSSTSNTKLLDFQRELNRASQTLEGAAKALREAEAEFERLETQLTKQGSEKAKVQKRQEELARDIEKQQKRLQKGAANRSRLIEQADIASRNIRDLGFIPEEAHSKYARISSDKALKNLHAAKEILKKYGHVNKKAFEQYNNLTQRRDALTTRHSELETSQQSIQELIDHLDQRKDEAIERTFKQVSKEFATIFERLVPAGRGRLIIQRKADRRAGNEDVESEDEAARNSIENYTGVGIAVSFNSKHDEQQRIQQLSGGQKSLCALALVFAIQRCDPAPFYLFDEIDANLDAQYRTAVADLLKEISEGGQFICTTFRPEMVEVAEKCYGVSFGNKTSSIDAVNRETALKFIEGKLSGS